MNWLVFIWATSLISQLGKHFWPSFAYVGGLPNDYLSPTIYWSELLSFILVLVSLGRTRPRLPVGIWIWPLLNVLMAQNQILALIFWFRWSLMAGVVWAVFHLRATERRAALAGLGLGLGLTVLLLLGQVLEQGALGGIWYWLGERWFRLSTPGIARWELGGILILRPYASFSHPNSLAGFLLASFILLNCLNQAPAKRGILGLVLLTASRSAVFAAGVFLVLKRFFLPKKVRVVLVVSLITLVAITLGSILVPPRDSWGAAINRRLNLARATATTINFYPVFGVGGGGGIPAVYQVSPEFKYDLWYQPVHNVWLLIWLEMGIAGLVVAVIGTGKLLQALVQRRSWAWLAGWLALLGTSVVDHYWLTLPQNRLVLALLLGFTLRRLKAPEKSSR